MEYRSLGRTGLKVSELALGTMQWGWTATEKTSQAIMDTYVAAGGNLLDTADIYSNWAPGNAGGVSEEIIGRWIKDRANRRDVILATKVRASMWPGPHGAGLSRQHIVEAVEGSLRRLQTDHIDLYQAHAFDAAVPIEETARAFEDLVREGKVLYVGASNYPAWRLAQAVGVSEVRRWARYESIQPHYNLLHRGEFERELRDLCLAQGLGVLPYSPLAGGFLTGKYRRRGRLPSSARAPSIRARYFEQDRAWRVLEVADRIAKEHGKAPAQVALGWLLSQPVVTAPIVGASTVAQIEESLGAVGFRLSPEEFEQLTIASGGAFSWND